MADKKGVFSDEEKAAMRQRSKELAAEAKTARTREQGEKDIQDAISKMKEPDKTLAIKYVEIVKNVAPNLMPKTWYGSPAYTNKEGKIIVFFQPGEKFGYRYATLGFQEDAHLDEGNMWPTSYALNKISEKEEKQITDLIKKAIS